MVREQRRADDGPGDPDRGSRASRATGQHLTPGLKAAAEQDPKARQVAVIDLGSNSWRLVVFTYAPGSWWKRTDELYETVRIGAGLDAAGRLSDEAIGRGLETLVV